MPKIVDLTDEQFKQLLDEYYAPPGKRSKMTQDEVKSLAERLNDLINVPIIGETTEEKILIKVVLKVDGFLYDSLPNEIYGLVRSVDKGLSDDEATRLISRLSGLANQKIDIPYLPESAEFIAIRFVIGVIINAARKGWDFYKAKDADQSELMAA